MTSGYRLPPYDAEQAKIEALEDRIRELEATLAKVREQLARLTPDEPFKENLGDA